MSGTGSLPDDPRSLPEPADGPPSAAERGGAERGEPDPGSRLEELLEQQGLREAALDEPIGAPDAPPGEPEDPLERALAGTRPMGDAREQRTGVGAESGAAAGTAEAGEQGIPDEEPGADLPDAPLFALLRTIEHEVGVHRIDRVWVFPPRRVEAGETAVVVVAAFPELDEDRRRVYAAHYTAPADAAEPRLALQEYGTAPTARVGRLVEDVMERLKDEPAAAPHASRIEGHQSRWSQALHELAEKHLEEMERNPRLRR